MTALLRYRLATLLHSQRYLAPVLVFLACLAMGAVNSWGPLLPIYALSAGAVFVAAGWLTVALVNIEEPERRAITIVNAGSSPATLLATIVVVLVNGLVLTVVGLLFPLVVGTHTVTVAKLGIGAGAQLLCVCAGIGIGLLCSRLVVARQGYSLLIALALMLLLLFVPGMPPVNPVLRLLSSGRAPVEMVWPLAGFGALAIVILLASAAIAQRVGTNKD